MSVRAVFLPAPPNAPRTAELWGYKGDTFLKLSYPAVGGSVMWFPDKSLGLPGTMALLIRNATCHAQCSQVNTWREDVFTRQSPLALSPK